MNEPRAPNIWRTRLLRGGPKIATKAVYFTGLNKLNTY